MGTLFIIATPIGNIQDITLRAIELLTTIPVIACEDTRRTGLLLQKIIPLSTNKELHKPRLLSYYEQNELHRIAEIISILKMGQDVALVTDAGTPAVSDPGFKLIRECIKEGIPVTSIPGASAVLTGLTVSGLPTDKFLFVGYLPHKATHSKKLLENILASQKLIKSTIILFEAPHKLLRTLRLMQEVLGDKEIVVCRELTKVYEEILRDTITQVIDHFEKTKPKGEIVLLFS